jgi:hypothetical protein
VSPHLQDGPRHGRWAAGCSLRQPLQQGTAVRDCSHRRLLASALLAATATVAAPASGRVPGRLARPAARRLRAVDCPGFQRSHAADLSRAQDATRKRLDSGQLAAARRAEASLADPRLFACGRTRHSQKLPAVENSSEATWSWAARARRLRSSWPQACQGSLFLAGWRPSNTRFDVGNISVPFVFPWWAMWIHTQASQLCLRWRMGCVIVGILIHGCGYNARPTQAPALRRDKSGALVLFFCDTHERCVPVRERSETETSTAKDRRSRSPATCRASGKEHTGNPCHRCEKARQ